VVVTQIEQGSRGLAFDPDYATDRRFHVDYIAAGADTPLSQSCPAATQLIP
jgi:hypothetical protein